MTNALKDDIITHVAGRERAPKSSAQRIGRLVESDSKRLICWCGSMAEQLICNQQVGGSTPFTSSILCIIYFIYGGIPEWPKGADCKSVVSDFGGPNPPSPTKIALLLKCFFSVHEVSGSFEKNNNYRSFLDNTAFLKRKAGQKNLHFCARRLEFSNCRAYSLLGSFLITTISLKLFLLNKLPFFRFA